MSDLERDPRYKFQLKMRPIADALYHAIIPHIVQIERFKKGTERHILDREFAIDVKFTLTNGMVLTGQEKFRQQAYNDVTVEYENDPKLHVKGDWFNLASQFYFVGYASQDERKFDRYVFLDWLRVVLATNLGRVPWKIQNQSDGRAKASFCYAAFSSLPVDCILARQG